MTQGNTQDEVGPCQTENFCSNTTAPSTRPQPPANTHVDRPQPAAAPSAAAGPQHNPQANTSCQPSESSAHQRPASDSSNHSTEQNFDTPNGWPSRQQPPGGNPTTQTSDTDGSQVAGSEEGGEGHARGRDKRSREQFDGVDSDGDDQFDDCNLTGPAGKISKKQRLHWSSELHTRFMNAVHHLGIEAAVPKRILQLMNVDGMTRDNVASHLQKYRLHLKKLAGVGANDPIPPQMIAQVQNNAMRLHKAKQQQEAHQMSLMKKSRAAEAEMNAAVLSQAVAHAPQVRPALFSTVYQQAAPSESGVLRPHPTRTSYPPPGTEAALHPNPDKGPQGQDAAEGAPWAAAFVPVTSPAGTILPASASMDALQLGYTLGLMQGGSGGWKPPGPHSLPGGTAVITTPTSLMSSPVTSLLHMPPQLQSSMYDPTTAAAVMMASSLHQQPQHQQQQQQQHHHQQQQQQQQHAALAMALQQMYCLPTYPQPFVVSNASPGVLRPQGDMAMFGLSPSGAAAALWPGQPSPYYPHGLLPPPPR